MCRDKNLDNKSMCSYYKMVKSNCCKFIQGIFLVKKIVFIENILGYFLVIFQGYFKYWI